MNAILPADAVGAQVRPFACAGLSTNQMNGQTYDAAGNQTSANGNTATYDAENQIATLAEAPAFGGGTEEYAYSGLGQRVLKFPSSGPTAVYVYDAFGQLVSEYSSVTPKQRAYFHEGLSSYETRTSAWTIRTIFTPRRLSTSPESKLRVEPEPIAHKQ